MQMRVCLERDMRACARGLAAQSFLMYNLVCLEEENPWLGLVDVPLLNQRLAHKRGAFERMVIAASRSSSHRPAGCGYNRPLCTVSGNRPLIRAAHAWGLDRIA